ncbi:hypothetical protein SCOCK_300085 [Actinacidiphila cocklensis]|uniref:Uncharacterized protein n=1 Tax=Actinacidiphila cocklensis TaxID=887465 RepID=A0A9W4E8D9_9ACTN|nr:hypothetical protein SCOCK_300085 [Actinacidiphila cocklensis]
MLRTAALVCQRRLRGHGPFTPRPAPPRPGRTAHRVEGTRLGPRRLPARWNSPWLSPWGVCGNAAPAENLILPGESRWKEVARVGARRHSDGTLARLVSPRHADQLCCCDWPT